MLALLAVPQTTLWDRDEPRFARAAVEMARSGDWVVPRFEGAPRAAKPPLVYWLMAASVHVFGPSELAVRFWAPIALALAAWWTFCLGARYWSTAVGVRAMWMLALSPLAIVEGTAATADALLLASVTAALVAGAAAISPEAPRSRVAALTAAMTAGVFVKGLVGVALPGAILVIAAQSLAPRDRLRAWRRVGVASAVAFVACSLWLMLAWRKAGAQFVMDLTWREHVMRAIAPRDGHALPLLAALPFYPLVVLLGFSPWTMFLPAGFASMTGAPRFQTVRDRLVAAWVLVPAIGFTLVMTKLPHYILPAWPALALMTAKGSLAPSARHLRIGRMLLFVTGLVESVVLVVLALRLGGELEPRILALAAGIGALTIWATWYAGRATDVMPGLAGVTVLLTTLTALSVAPSVEALKPIPALCRAIVTRYPPTVPVAVAGIDEPSLVFYLDRQRLEHLTTPVAVERWLKEAEPGILVTTREVWGAIPADVRARATETAAADGLNIARGNRVALIAVERNHVSAAARPTSDARVAERGR
jgi:4-amino-4-deoxy-L-arabinose transferase-like glycosyltransferase